MKKKIIKNIYEDKKGHFINECLYYDNIKNSLYYKYNDDNNSFCIDFDNFDLYQLKEFNKYLNDYIKLRAIER